MKAMIGLVLVFVGSAGLGAAAGKLGLPFGYALPLWVGPMLIAIGYDLIWQGD